VFGLFYYWHFMMSDFLYYYYWDYFTMHYDDDYDYSQSFNSSSCYYCDLFH